MASNLLTDLTLAVSRPGWKWVARWSKTGEGFRLHQTDNPGDDLYSQACIADTAEEAIVKFLEMAHQDKANKCSSVGETSDE